MLFKLGALAISVMLGSTLSLAQGVSPDTLVKTVTEDVLTSIKQNPGIQGGNNAKAVALVEQKVSPHFDFARMSALATGANWRKATPDQQKLITDEFRKLLVRTYSSALGKYRDQVIETSPPRPPAADGSVIVRSSVKQSGSEPITIDYHMQKAGAEWKVFDIAVAGVSLVINYRESFATEVRAGGIDALIKSLVRKNQELTQAG